MAKCKLSKLQWGRSKSTYTQKHNRANSSVAKAMNTREHNVQDNVCARVHPALRIKQASITVQARANNSKLHICASRILRLLFFSDDFFFFFSPLRLNYPPSPFQSRCSAFERLLCARTWKSYTRLDGNGQRVDSSEEAASFLKSRTTLVCITWCLVGLLYHQTWLPFQSKFANLPPWLRTEWRWERAGAPKSLCNSILDYWQQHSTKLGEGRNIQKHTVIWSRVKICAAIIK